jgi:hypothetical protein
MNLIYYRLVLKKEVGKMKKWERIMAIVSLVVGVVGIIVTCISITQAVAGGNKSVEPMSQIIILGDVIVVDAEIVKSE